MYVVDSYGYKGKQTDFMQLGWLVAWILELTMPYHNWTLESLAKSSRDDEFICNLLTKGNFDMELLLRSDVVMTLET